MKKKIAFAGLAISASLTLPFTAQALTTSQTDTIEVTIPSNCELSYGSTAHSDGDGAWGTGTAADTLSATRTNSSVTTDLGSTSFSVTCNDGGGSQVSLTATSLTSGDDAIDFSDDTPSSTASSWGVNNGTSWISSGGDVWSSDGSVSGSTFSVTYGLGLDSTQPAGTYTGTATYTLAHPYTPPTPPVTTKYMQDVATWGSTLTAGEQIQVVDKRDDKTYWVAKLADGNIWMTQNLDFVISTSGTTLTTADSNVTANKTLTATNGWTNTDVSFYEGGDNYLPNGTDSATSTSSLVADSTNWHYHVGNYYNWTAATAGSGTSSITSTDAPESICPKGWRLSTSGTSTTNYTLNKLLTAYGYSDSSDAILLANPLWFTRTGFVTGGSLLYQGITGSVWTGMAHSESDKAYILAFLSTYVDPRAYSGRDSGLSVRCVAI